MCPQRHADSDIVRVLTDEIRHHSVDPHCCKENRNRRKNAQELHVQAGVAHRSVQNLLHRL